MAEDELPAFTGTANFTEDPLETTAVQTLAGNFYRRFTRRKSFPKNLDFNL
jgi:hypothetical protein